MLIKKGRNLVLWIMQSSFNEPEDRKYFVMYFAFNETAKQPFSKKEVYCSFLRVNILKHLSDLGSQNSNENQYGLTWVI